MTKAPSVSEPTFSIEVLEALDDLAADRATASRCLDAIEMIAELHAALVEQPAKIVRRHAPRELSVNGERFLVFVIPSPLAMVKAIDTFCIIQRPADGRMHVLKHANCSSMKEYERTRTAMHLEVSKLTSVKELLT